VSIGISPNEESLFIPSPDFIEGTATLSKRISAIPLLLQSNQAAKLGPLCQLPTGTIVELCGMGYNERTVKVRSGKNCYFVFREDLA
jgi:hypothetical protein